MTLKVSYNLHNIWKHFEKGSFGIVSAYLNDQTKKENEKRSLKLKEKVRDLGYGYKEIRGVWKAESGITFEYPLFIPKLTPEDAKVLGKVFQQEAVIFSNKSNEVILWDPNKDKVMMTFSKIETNGKEVWEGYSEIRGKKFRFAEVEWTTPIPNPEKAKSSKWMLAMGEESYFKESCCDFTRGEEKSIEITFKTLQKLK